MEHQLLTGWDRFPRLDVLGSGAFGVVHLSRDLLYSSEYFNELVAVKTIALQRISDAEANLAMTEVAILRELDHPNVLKFIDCFIDDDQLLCCVTEYVNGGDLAGLIRDAKQANRFIDSFVLVDITRQILEGLAYLHSQAIIHRDIKPANIYLSSTGAIKIGDFGVSKLVSCNLPEAATFIGTPYYISPELARGETYSFGADVWALGVVVYELHTLRLPFFARNIMALMASIAKGEYDTAAVEKRALSDVQREGLLSSCGPEYVLKSESLGSLVASLVKSMLVAEKANRMSAQEILSTYFGVSSAAPDDSGLALSARTSRGHSLLEEDAAVFRTTLRRSLRSMSTSGLPLGSSEQGRPIPDVAADLDEVLAGEKEQEYADDFEEDESQILAVPCFSAPPACRKSEFQAATGKYDDDDQWRVACVVLKKADKQPDPTAISYSEAPVECFGRLASAFPRGEPCRPAAVFRDPQEMERMLRQKALKYHERRLAAEKKAREREQQQEQHDSSCSSLPSPPSNFAVAFSSAVSCSGYSALGQSALAAKSFAMSLMGSSSSSHTSLKKKSIAMRRAGCSAAEDDEDTNDEELPKPIPAAVFISSTSETVPLRRVSTITRFKSILKRVSAILRSRSLIREQSACRHKATETSISELADTQESLAESLKLSYLDAQGDRVEVGTSAEWRYVVEEHLTSSMGCGLLVLRSAL
jgi:serine/threonine protein kinase